EVGAMFSTEMGCEPAMMDQDTWLAEFLTSSPTASLDDDVLVLEGDGTTINMLDRETADPDLPMEGTLWVVDGIVANEGVSTVPGGATASITITDGTAAVETGCNAASTSVEVTETTLMFSPMAVTLMACPPDETALQDAVLAVLDGKVTYEIEANRLSIRRTTPQGEIGLELSAS
ncbi:MAG: META domain-containing protein, partial [Actinobacteria bacterium]|nr:META domain-containing protein [Actinomycetota bacterium]